MSPEQSHSLIPHYFPSLSEQQLQQFSELEGLYREWNDKINVISRKDIDKLYLRHVLHSLGIAKVLDFQEGSHVLDVGTGGGFPGIPLAILFPQCRFHLVDSIGKKIMVVKEVAKALHLNNVKAEHARAENLSGEYEFVVSRAVTRLKPFYQWVKAKIQKEQRHPLKNGILYLKGGELQEELQEVKKKHRLYSLSDYFEEDFFETKYVVHVPIYP